MTRNDFEMDISSHDIIYTAINNFVKYKFQSIGWRNLSHSYFLAHHPGWVGLSVGRLRYQPNIGVTFKTKYPLLTGLTRVTRNQFLRSLPREGETKERSTRQCLCALRIRPYTVA